MHPLYSELLILCGDNALARAAVQAAAIVGTPEKFRVQMCKETRRQFFPAIPVGMIRDSHCFWLKFASRGVWECAWGTNVARKDKAAAWLKEQREKRQAGGLSWPPVPAYKRAVVSPQPMDGKGGSTAWTARKS